MCHHTGIDQHGIPIPIGFCISGQITLGVFVSYGRDPSVRIEVFNTRIAYGPRKLPRKQAGPLGFKEFVDLLELLMSAQADIYSWEGDDGFSALDGNGTGAIVQDCLYKSARIIFSQHVRQFCIQKRHYHRSSVGSPGQRLYSPEIAGPFVKQTIIVTRAILTLFHSHDLIKDGNVVSLVFGDQDPSHVRSPLLSSSNGLDLGSQAVVFKRPINQIIHGSPPHPEVLRKGLTVARPSWPRRESVLRCEHLHLCALRRSRSRQPVSKEQPRLSF